MRKFIVKDEDGKDYTVEEMIAEKTTEDEDVVEETIPETDEPSALSEDEINALKSLAAVADKLIALIPADEEESVEEETIDDEDPLDEEDEDKEEVIDTCKSQDSIKGSFGKIESQKANVADSEDVRQEEIANAWAKRCGGNK